MQGHFGFAANVSPEWDQIILAVDLHRMAGKIEQANGVAARVLGAEFAPKL